MLGWKVSLSLPKPAVMAQHMKIRILYHDHCFDGAASSALFSRFMADAFHPGASFEYTGMAHKASQLFEDSLFDGDENAIVDFKYSTNEKLTWWFDHHQSAFLTPEDAEHYRRTRNSRRLFFDPTYRSCTEWIAHIAQSEYGYQAADLAELIHWAGIVDGALYSSADEAVLLDQPATKLVLLIEAVPGSDMVQRVIRMMQRRPLAEIVEQSEVRQAFQPLYERHLRSIDIIRKVGHYASGVIYFDVADYDMEGYNKFVPYYLFPEATYTVSVSLSTFRTKVSVGSNPWARIAPSHNLATICERYGGGGHPRVGAISFERGELARAREVAQEIARELRGS